jgi:hypothetical protein
LLARRGVRFAEAATTTLVARVVDFLCLLLLAVLLLPLWVDERGSVATGAQVLVLPVLGVALISAALIRLRRQAPNLPLPNSIARALHTAHSGLNELDGRQLAATVLWTLPSWALEGVVLFVAARAAGLDLPVQAAIGVTAITILFQVFHVTPGGLGIYEASMTGALTLHGVSVAEGATVALLAHGLKFAYAFTVGLAFSIREGVDLTQGMGGTG